MGRKTFLIFCTYNQHIVTTNCLFQMPEAIKPAFSLPHQCLRPRGSQRTISQLAHVQRDNATATERLNFSRLKFAGGYGESYSCFAQIFSVFFCTHGHVVAARQLKPTCRLLWSTPLVHTSVTSSNERPHRVRHTLTDVKAFPYAKSVCSGAAAYEVSINNCCWLSK